MEENTLLKGFNSTLVQLKVALPTYSGAIFPLFQFYLSSIKRVCYPNQPNGLHQVSILP